MDIVPGHDHLPVAHADQAGRVRDPLRGTVRRRALRDARPGRRRRRRRIRRLARRQPTFGADAGAGRGGRRRGRRRYAVCAACHGAHGEGNQALNAPKLAGQAGLVPRAAAAQLQAGPARRRARATTYRRARWRAIAATLPDDAAIGNVVAYIAVAARPRAPQATVTGNATRGAALYTTCASCHGARGPGHLGDRTRRGSPA